MWGFTAVTLLAMVVGVARHPSGWICDLALLPCLLGAIATRPGRAGTPHENDGSWVSFVVVGGLLLLPWVLVRLCWWY